METANATADVDFTLGIRADLLLEGVPVAGQVGDKAVLLVRSDGAVHAIGAHCTHHGAPLKDGLVTEGEIRCPWHHACFSLASGDVTAPPALNPLERWQVEQIGDRIFVRDKCAQRDPLALRGEPHAKLHNVVILGAGAAGSAAAEALRMHGFKGIITIVDPDAAAPYDRTNLSKDYLAGTAPEDWLPLRPADFYAQHGIRRVIDTAVSIDAKNHVVMLSSGHELSYDALLLATGASAIRPPIDGADRNHVHSLRSLADCKALMQATGPGTKVLIAGASFIGLEAAAALRQRNVDVTVVAPELIPFENVLGPTIGASLMKLHESHGVKFRMNAKLVSIGEASVMLDDGTELSAAVVLLGVGARLDLNVAATAGVAIDNGVLVDDHLETSVPGIYAAGDIARYPEIRNGQHVRIEHWVVAQRQGRVAARNMLGIRAPFTSVPFFWTQHYDVSVSYVGHAPDFTSIRIDGSPDTGYGSASFMRGDTLLAYASIGRDRDSLEIEKEMEQRAVHER